MSRCRDCPASALWVESGPTPRLSRAAERAMMKRHGGVKEYMFVNRRWRRRRQALLGRGMADDGRASRPSVRDPAPDPLACDRLYGTRSGTRSSRTHATDLTARDPAPAPFARDPAPAPCARDRLYGTRSGTGSFRTRLTLRHAIRLPAPLARDRFYGTRSGTDSFRTRRS